jgi:hypothetical protein
MWRWTKAIIKWTLIAVAIVAVAIGLLLWRDSHRDEDFWSCNIQDNDRSTISSAKSSAETSKEEDRASTNQFLDKCMKDRGHTFVGGTNFRQCLMGRVPSCYSSF